MTGCVAITRDGRGDLWCFGSYAEADQHPIVQYGDRIVDGPKSICTRLTLNEIPAILARINRNDLAKQILDCLSAPSHRQKVQRVSELSLHVWTALTEAALPPPTDPPELVQLIVRDRKLSIKESRSMEETTPTPDTTVEPKAKKTRAPKEKSTDPAQPKAERYNREHKIRLLSNAEGVQYGPENNPKRAGSASHDRFALYKDGMTIGAAIEAGVKSEDIAWDVKKGFIEIQA